MLADPATTAIFALAPHALVLAEATATAVFAMAPQPLMLADPAAAAVFAPAPRRDRCRHSLYIGSSVTGARRDR